MAYEFVKLNETPITELDPTSGFQNAIVEEDGEIKRVPLYTLSGGYNSSSSNGGYAHYFLSEGYVYKTSNADSTDTSNYVTYDDFMNDYNSRPVLFRFYDYDHGAYTAPILSVFNLSGYKLYHINAVGNLTGTSVNFNYNYSGY